MPSLTPSNPSEVMVIREVVPNVITTLSAPFARFGVFKVGGRGTIVRLRSGPLAVFSPVALTPEVKDIVTRLGEVKYIIAPDLEHHIYLGPWYQAYPQAKVIGPEGLYEKRQKQKNEDVPFAVVFSVKDKESIRIDPEFDAEFDYEFVHVHPNKELVFHHKPTRTLIEADLMFNLPAFEQYRRAGDAPTAGILSKLFNAINNTNGEAKAQRRLIYYAYSSADRPAFNKSIAKINGWDFDRLIPCHGETIDTGAKGIFEKIMAWHLESKKSH